MHHFSLIFSLLHGEGGRKKNQLLNFSILFYLESRANTKIQICKNDLSHYDGNNQLHHFSKSKIRPSPKAIAISVIFWGSILQWRGFHLPKGRAKLGERGFSRRRRCREKFLSPFFNSKIFEHFFRNFWKFVSKNAIKIGFLGGVGRYISTTSKTTNFGEKYIYQGQNF